jgi:hypothetical protein
LGRGHRLALVVAALVTAVVAFVVIGSDETDERADDPAAERTERAEREPTATARSALPPPPQEVVLKGGAPEGGVAKVVFKKGDTVRLLVSSDTPDEIHVHGYDVTRRVAPGKPARFRFEADVEGQFEIESHAAEDAGREALIARLVVQPS